MQMDLFIKLQNVSLEKERDLKQLELKHNLKFPDEFTQFFINYELDNFKFKPEDIDSFVGYQSERINGYVYSEILLSHFCSIFEMENWYEMFFDMDFFNGEGIQVAISYGSTFIILIANEGSPNYGKVLYYDVEIAPGQCFILGDTFNEFLSCVIPIKPKIQQNEM